MPLERGSRIGPYEVLLRLGAGGMGEVYRARDPRLGREVAIKVLREGAASDRDALKRFVSEARAASALNHPNILTVYEIGEGDSGPYIVTELVDGETVRALLEREPMPVGQALDIAIQAAEGLAKAHEAGLVHRDIKPENLMVTRDGLVKILDFGLAKLFRPEADPAAGATAFARTETGMIVGTAGYLSPEQLRGEAVDGRSDIFALGTVLYEMVAGANPFRRDNSADTFIAILREEPEPLSSGRPGLPRDLSEVAARALAKKPEERFPGARAFAAELKRIRKSMTTSESATRLAPRPAAPAGRRRKPLWIAAALAVAAAAAVLLVRRGPPAPTETTVAYPEGQIVVAVIPFRDDSGDAELSKAGIGEVLSNAFVQALNDVPDVYVVSPVRLDGVAQGQKRRLSEASRDLAFARDLSMKAQATAILSGSLVKVGSTFVLSATLTELPSGRLIATFRSESRAKDRLLVELTGPINEGLRATLAPRRP